MTIPDANSILMSGGGKFAKFENPGDTVTGTITDIGAPYQVREYNQDTKRSDGPLKYTKAGKPIYAFHLTLATTERRPEDPEDDGTRVIDVNSWRMQDALRNAVRTAGARGLEPGGQVRLAYTGDEVPGDRRSGKKFTADYSTATNTTLMGQPTSAPPQTPTSGAVDQQATPAAKAQKLINAGMSDTEVNQITGLDLQQVALIRQASENTPF